MRLEAQAGARLARDEESSAQHFDALAHTAQPEAHRSRRQIRPSAVVLDAQHHLVAGLRFPTPQGYLEMSGARVPRAISEPLLDQPVEREIDLLAETLEHPGERESKLHAGQPRAPLIDEA